MKTQRSLLEAEALAHARAMQESIQLENKLRDTYSNFRRSAYDINSGVDESAFRLKPPRSSTGPNGVLGHHVKSSSRDITVLENGLIVEHVDIRKEEKEEERRRKQEKRDRSRARKTSRGSAADVMSLYSVHSLAPHTDSGLGPMQSSRHSAISSVRPISSLTAPAERQPSLGQVYSQASFSDAHSRGSISPRRSRFFGFKNLSAVWRSQDSLAHSGISGSMMDMQYVISLNEEVLSNRPFVAWLFNMKAMDSACDRLWASEAGYPLRKPVKLGSQRTHRMPLLRLSKRKRNRRRSERALQRYGNS